MHVTVGDLLIAGGVLGAMLFVLVRYLSPNAAERLDMRRGSQARRLYEEALEDLRAGRYTDLP